MLITTRKDSHKKSLKALAAEVLQQNTQCNEILKYVQLKKIIPLSRSTIWMRVKEETFPKPVLLVDRSVGWRKEVNNG